MRTVRRACFASAALLLVLAVVTPALARAADDPDADRPVVWGGNAAASAFHAQADSKNGVLPVYQPFYVDFPDAQSNWDPNTANARASTYYPGPTAQNGINLICDQVLTQIFAPGRLPPSADAPLCSPAPKFPTIAQADNATPDARVDGSQLIGSGLPLTVTATSAIAHGDRKSVSSDAVIGSVNLVGTPATGAAGLGFRRQAAAILHGPAAAAAVTSAAADTSTLHIDGAVAHTRQVYDTGGALLVTASSVLKGVSLAGGAVHIDSITSSSTSRTDGRGIATHEEHFTLGGVTVSGQPAAIDETGVHVGGSSTSAKPLTDALNSALKAMGARIAVADASGDATNDNPRTVHSNVQGLMFYVEQLLSVPNFTDTYYATFTLGAAGTTATAASERNSSPPAEEGGIGGLGTPDTPAVPPDVAAPSLDTGTPGLAATPGTPGTPASRRGSAVLGSRNRRSGLAGFEEQLIGAVISHRFDLLYLAFTIAFVGVCLSSRLLVPRARGTT
ncbi:MAG: hypothetical protein JWP02_2818 [Acidimicrobiales bacterium]|nr:hypothetical protein [Acidimicrobiales bacterium]